MPLAQPWQAHQAECTIFMMQGKHLPVGSMHALACRHTLHVERQQKFVQMPALRWPRHARGMSALRMVQGDVGDLWQRSTLPGVGAATGHAADASAHARQPMQLPSQHSAFLAPVVQHSTQAGSQNGSARQQAAGSASASQAAEPEAQAGVMSDRQLEEQQEALQREVLASSAAEVESGPTVLSSLSDLPSEVQMVFQAALRAGVQPSALHRAIQQWTHTSLFSGPMHGRM